MVAVDGGGGSWWWLGLIDAMMCDHICRSGKFRSIRIAILNVFLCLL